MKSLFKAIALCLALGTSLPAAATVIGGVHWAGPTTGMGPHNEYVVWLWNPSATSSSGQLVSEIFILMSSQECWNKVNEYKKYGYVINTNQPGGPCHSFLANGSGIHTIRPNIAAEALDFSDAAKAVYQEGVKELRDKYRLDQFELEQDELLRSIMAADGKDK